jgi:hypothetical protein
MFWNDSIVFLDYRQALNKVGWRVSESQSTFIAPARFTRTRSSHFKTLSQIANVLFGSCEKEDLRVLSSSEKSKIGLHQWRLYSTGPSVEVRGRQDNAFCLTIQSSRKNRDYSVLSFCGTSRGRISRRFCNVVVYEVRLALYGHMVFRVVSQDNAPWTT